MRNDHVRQTSIILTFSTLLSVSCNSQSNAPFDSEAVELNNRALEISWSNPDSALTLLNMAVEIDEDYYLAHNHQASIYCAQGEYEKAINASKQGLKTKPDLAEAVVMLGMLYDHTGQPEKAQAEYQNAIKLFDERLSQSDKNENANKLNRAHAFLLMGREEEGKEAVQQLLKEDPENFSVQMLVDFDKEEYLYEIFRQGNK